MSEIRLTDNLELLTPFWDTLVATVALSPRTFRLEFAAMLGLAILFSRISPQMKRVPLHIKWFHFGLVSIYSLVGVAGARLVLMFCFGHSTFVEMFSQPNVLRASPGLMQSFVLLFALSGTILFVAAMELGRFRRWARGVFTYFVLPCGMLYPPTMLIALGVIGHAPRTITLAYSAIAFFLVFGVLGILFYRSKMIEREMR